MAFRIEKRAFALLRGLILLAPAGFAQQALEYDVWHPHSRPPHIKKAGSRGTLTITDKGIAFASRKEARRWDYQDIEQLKIAPKSIKVLTYRDNLLKLGADRSYKFEITGGGTFANAYERLKHRLDQRLVSEIPDQLTNALWRIPVKHLVASWGDQGVLEVGPAEIVYRSSKKNESRTWRYEDIDNVSSSGPFSLTITTFERSRVQYGSRKAFNFQLKQPIDEARYNALWLRLNRGKGLQLLDYYRQADPAPLP